jgi:pimeloyl-[acyl-carrier protein] methyl ester esterase
VAALRVAVDVLRYTDLRPELPSLRVPVLIVQGGQDRIVPTDAARYLARSLPDARLELIAPAGHAPFITHPDAVVRTLRVFLRA